MTEVLRLIDDKGHVRTMDLFNQVQNTYDQFIDFKREQMALNKKLCSNNCCVVVNKWKDEKIKLNLKI